jgi:hypothetical protein
MIRKWAPCSTMKGVVYDKEMGTVLHFRTIRLQSRGVKPFKRQSQS